MTETKKKSKKASSSKKNKTNILIDINDIKGMAYIALGLILSISTYTDLAGALSRFSKVFVYKLIGIGMFIIPIFFIFIGFNIMKNNGGIILTRKSVGSLATAIILTLFVSTIKTQIVGIESFYKSLEFILTEETLTPHGGLIGHAISYPLIKLIGYLGVYILYSSMLSITLMMTFDIKLKDLNNGIKTMRADIKNKISYVEVEKERTFEIKESNELLEKPKSKENERILYKNEEDKINIEILGFEKELEKEESEKKTINSAVDINEVITKEIDGGYNTQHSVEQIYKYPNTNLLKNNGKARLKIQDKNELMQHADKLEETLRNFGVKAVVKQVTRGPSVTRFELHPEAGVKVSKIVNLQDDIALALAAGGVRIEAPIPGKAAVGIEVPNKTQTPVFLKEVLDSKEFNTSDKKLAFALGKDIAGKCMVADLSKMPHLLIAGATGSGKSVCVNSLIISLIYKYSPKDVKLLMVDPKVVELSVYNDIPHLLIPVVTDPKKAAGALNWAVNEMNRRYNLFSTEKVKNIESYNSLSEKGIIEEKLPYVVIIVDELADLMMACPGDVEDYICRLAQMARAAGMHLIIATQRPSVDVITGTIKSNIPSRISFAVSSGIDSRTIIDQYGAEKLLGRGDMLYYPMGENKPLRVQGAFISEEEVENVVEFIRNKDSIASYQEEIINHINKGVSINSNKVDTEEDELLEEAIKIVIEYQQASASFLQRKLNVGFNRASRIVELLEERGVVSGKNGTKPRQVLILKENLENN